MMDLSKLSDADLIAIHSGDLSKLSNEGIKQLYSSSLTGAQQSPKVDPTTDMSGLDKFRAGMGKSFVDAEQGIGQALTEAAVNLHENPIASAVAQIIPGAGTAASALKLFGSMPGVNQNLVDLQRQAQDERSALDKPLMSTRAGLAGDIAGNVAISALASLIPGANTYTGATMLGGILGAMQPVGTNESRTKNAAVGSAFGFGGNALGRALGATYQGAKAYLSPLFQGGQEQIVGDTLKKFAASPQVLEDALKYGSEIPGYTPTLAEAAQDPGISTLYKALRNNPNDGLKAQIVNNEVSNNKALIEALGKISGSSSDLEKAIADRAAASSGAFDDSFAANRDRAAPIIQQAIDMGRARTGGIGGPAMVDAVKQDVRNKLITPGMESLSKLPDFQSAIKSASNMMANKGLASADDPMVTAEGLQHIKFALDDMINPPPGSAKTASKVEQAALQSMKNRLMSEIENVAPGFNNANSIFAENSGPVNQMVVGQALRDKLVPALTDLANNPARLTPSSYANALRDSASLVKNETGQNIPLEKVMTPEQMATINGIGKHVANSSAATAMGGALGSDTFQNMQANNVLRQVIGPLGVPESWAEGTFAPGLIKALMTPHHMMGTDKSITQKLAEALMNPSLAEQYLNTANSKQIVSPLIQALSNAGGMTAASSINRAGQ